MRGLLAMIVVTALPPPAPTHPGFLDASRLQAVCAKEGPDAAQAQVYCMGYVMGVTDQLLARPSRRTGPTACPPGDLSGKAAVEIVRRYGRYAEKGVSAAEFVRFALERAYPCPIERSSP